MSNIPFLFFFMNVDIPGDVYCKWAFVSFSLFDFCFVVVVYQVRSILKIFFSNFFPLNPTIELDLDL